MMPTTTIDRIDSVIVAYRSEKVIERSVSLARRLNGLVTVVDHGDGESARRAAAAGVLTIEDPTNPGFGAGQNRGMAQTSSAYVLLCNPDAEIVPSAIRDGGRLLAARPGVAAVQGMILNLATAQPERSSGVELGPIHLLGRALGGRPLLALRPVRRLARQSSRLRDHVDRVPRGPVDVETLAATAILVRRSAFDEVGGFDPSYFLYGEDLDFCRRLRQAGWRLVTVPDVWATHVGGGSAESTHSRDSHWWRGTMHFAAQWWGAGSWAIAVLAAGVRWSQLTLIEPRHARAYHRALLKDPFTARRRCRAERREA